MLTSLYIHIPFCSQICTYCDFHKEMAKQSKKEKYINALIKELQYHKDEIKNVSTVYIGGGTPTSLELPDLEKLLQAINTYIHIDNVIEFTIESNPNDFTEELVLLLKKYRINRVSIGVQTFQEKHLQFLGRTHRKEDVKSSVKLLRKHNFQNISVDMMFSLINQTLDELRQDIQEVLTLDIDHISYYSLILEEKSKLSYLLQNNQIRMNNEDLEGFMYNEVIDTLTSHNFTQYEISNFSKPGYSSLHNQTYWLNKEYLGIGSGSHSMYQGKRFFNTSNIAKYINMIESNNYDFTSSYEYNSLHDEMMLGLRLIKGVNIEKINQKYQIELFEEFPELSKYINDNIIEISDGYLRFTRNGILLGNLVFQIFVEVL